MTVHLRLFKFLKYCRKSFLDFSRGLHYQWMVSDSVFDKVLSLTTGGTLSYHCESTDKQKQQVIKNAIALRQKFKVNVMFTKIILGMCRCM